MDPPATGDPSTAEVAAEDLNEAVNMLGTTLDTVANFFFQGSEDEANDANGPPALDTTTDSEDTKEHPQYDPIIESNSSGGTSSLLPPPPEIVEQRVSSLIPSASPSESSAFTPNRSPILHRPIPMSPSTPTTSVVASVTNTPSTASRTPFFYENGLKPPPQPLLPPISPTSSVSATPLSPKMPLSPSPKPSSHQVAPPAALVTPLLTTEPNSDVLSSIIDKVVEKHAPPASPKANDKPQSDAGVVSLLQGSSPMARMRDNSVAQAARLPNTSMRSPPRPSGDDVISKKHEKWRRQIIQRERERSVANSSSQQPPQGHGRRRARARSLSQDQKGCAGILMQGNTRNTLLEHLIGTACGGVGPYDEEESSFQYEYDRAISESWGDSYDSMDSMEDDETDNSDEDSSFDDSEEEDSSELAVIEDHEAAPVSEITEHTAGYSLQTQQLGSMLGSELPADEETEEEKPGRVFTTSLQDKNFIKTFIAEAAQEGLPFNLHESSQQDPLDILMFIEVGFMQSSSGNHVGPRLAWYGEGSPDKLEGAMDLLDIYAVEKASPLQVHKDFPFCMPGNSVMLSLSRTRVMVLEARSEDEALRFVHGLRWIIARLAFNLIIGNPIISCELLDIVSGSANRSIAEEKAMNDVTNQLVDKVVLSSIQQNQLL